MTAVATTEDHARRWAERARLDLEAAADRGESGLSKIRTAISERHDEALGYRSLGDYLRTEYADALGNVCRVFGVEFRRQVVAELTEAGLSTRAIAPVVGADYSTVSRDRARVADATPAVDTETGEVSEDYPSDDVTGGEVTPSVDVEATEAEGAAPEGEQGPSRESVNGSDVDDAGASELAPPPAPRPPVVGIDGKTYTRPGSRKPPRRSLVDDARDAGQELRKAVERLERIAADDRLPRNTEEVAAHLRHHLDRAIQVCQHLDRTFNSDKEPTP